MKRFGFALALVAAVAVIGACKKAEQQPSSSMSDSMSMMSDSMKMMSDSMKMMSDSMKMMDTTKH
jgi:outer membrane lipoprotein-sorting protein